MYVFRPEPKVSHIVGFACKRFRERSWRQCIANHQSMIPLRKRHLIRLLKLSHEGLVVNASEVVVIHALFLQG